MVPSTESGATNRRLVDRVAIGILIGVVALSVGGAALLTVYLNRIGDAAEGLHRVDGLAAYEGRPEPVVVDGVSAVNYLLMTVDDAGALQSVVIAHLSATRRDLTLIALPADLLADDGSGTVTLASSYAADARRTARAVENLTGARMDHQVQLGLDGFAGVVDVLGGIDVGQGRMDGAQALAALDATSDGLRRSLLTAHMLKAAMAQASMGAAITDPTRFDRAMDALTPCLTVDSQLTVDEVRATMVESRVRGDRVEAWPLAANSVGAATRPDPAGLAELRASLAADSFALPAVPVRSSLATPGTSAIVPGSPAPSPPWSSATPGPGAAATPTPAPTTQPKVDVSSPTPSR